jgi:general secretion pathway protein A
MFLKFFGLREQPFGVTPDPRFLYLSPAHREALASLYYGIETGRGFLALIAKPGMGKTTLLFHLLEKFRTTARTAFLFQTQCTSREFMRFLLAELGYETKDHDFVRMHEEFNKHLLQEARAGHRFIVVVDEAQNLDASVLETIRLLSDFETPRAKLLQIVLAGQPELADKLASRHLAQLRQRVSLLNGLQPLSVEETKNYIEHRLRVAGYQGQELFTAQALAAIASFTEGVPRNINNFCFNAMSLAFALRQTTVDTAIVQEVIADLDITPYLSQNWLTEPTGPVNAGLEEELASEQFAQDQANVRRMDGHRHRVPARSVESVPAIAQRRAGNGGSLTPTEARAYLEQVARSLKNWQ